MGKIIDLQECKLKNSFKIPRKLQNSLPTLVLFVIAYWLGFYIILDSLYLYGDGLAYLTSIYKANFPLGLALFALVGLLLLLIITYLIVWGFTAVIGTWSLIMLVTISITNKFMQKI